MKGSDAVVVRSEANSMRTKQLDSHQSTVITAIITFSHLRLRLQISDRTRMPPTSVRGRHAKFPHS